MALHLCAPTAPRNSVLIFESERLFGYLLKEHLELRTNLAVLGVVTNYEEATRLCSTKQPDVVTVSLQTLNGDNGFMLVTKLKKSLIKGKIIILTRDNSQECIEQAIAAGASAFVSKDCTPESMLEVIYNLIEEKDQKELYVLPECLRNSSESEKGNELYGSLTESEKEVLLLIAKGYTVKEIAFHLRRACTTVYSHQQNIKEKLNVHRANDLFNLALNYYLAQRKTA